MIFSGIFLALGGHLVSGQESSQLLIPSEAYKMALAPYMQTRSQPNDLTDADKYALGIGITQASRDCLLLSPNIAAFNNNSKELFGLGQLCMFGRQYEPARTALVAYLALPQPLQREQALALLSRAFLGLNSAVSAEAQVNSLMRDYPFDPLIDDAIDQVIDATQGDPKLNFLALKMCAVQNASTLPLLSAGKVLEGKSGSTSSAALFSDAVRCAALVHDSGKSNDLSNLTAILRQPNWAGTADLVTMQSALERQQMVGTSAPIPSLRGYAPGIRNLVPKTVSLKQGTVLLVPFTLWSPSTATIARNLVKLMSAQPIYAITSWHANSGGEDVRSNEVLADLRAWQKDLPKQVSILIVPDSVLSQFHIDVFPAGILTRDGTVLSNIAFSRDGNERLMKNALALPGGTK